MAKDVNNLWVCFLKGGLRFRLFREPGKTGWILFVKLRPGRKLHPWLRARRPDVRKRLQPTGVVKRTRLDADNSRGPVAVRRVVYPSAAAITEFTDHLLTARQLAHPPAQVAGKALQPVSVDPKSHCTGTTRLLLALRTMAHE